MMYAYFDALYHNGALFTAAQMFDAMTVIALASTSLCVYLLRGMARRGVA